MSPVREVEYDHHSPAYAQAWRSLHDQIRSAGCPVAHSSSYDGFYVLTRYDDVASAVKDDATFASYHRPGTEWQGIMIPQTPSVTTPIELDPPDFQAYRSLLNLPFSPANSRSWGPWLRDVATALLDAVIETGHCDLVHDFASPLPALLTAKMLGVPLTDWRLYSDAAHDVVRFPPDSREQEVANQLMISVLGRAYETMQARRADPKDDLISTWVHAEVNGEKISDEVLMQMCLLVITGGNDTTTSLFSNCFAWLTEHPAQREWLAADFNRIDHACEEFLRYFTPTQALARTVTRDVEFGGHTFVKGDRVLLSFAAANFDPQVSTIRTRFVSIASPTVTRLSASGCTAA